MEPGVIALSVFVIGLYGSVTIFCVNECYKSYTTKNKIKYKRIQMTSI